MSQFEPDPAFPPRRRHPGWGGKRAGAGARRGNLNALKHGAYSRQAKDLIRFIALDSQFRRVAIRLSRAQVRILRSDARALVLDDDAGTRENIAAASTDPSSQAERSPPATKRSSREPSTKVAASESARQ